MLGGILSIANSALATHQRAAEIASHNIANALTEGYSRQRAELSAGTPFQSIHGPIGTGVRLHDIARTRDAFLDANLRRESAAASAFQMRGEMLGQIEAAFLEPGDHGLGGALDAFWSSWSDLANYPADPGAREVVRERGSQLAAQFNRLSASLDAAQNTTRGRLDAALGDLDRLSATVADLNRQVVAAEVGGHTAADLRDARDLAIDRIAQITPVQVVERSNGSVGVIVAGVTVVDDAIAHRLRFTGGALETERGTPVTSAEGALGELVRILDTDIPALRDRLDTLARGVVGAVNGLHRQGTGPAGNTDVAFFDDQGGDLTLVTAGNLALSAAVSAPGGALEIAAGRPSAAGAYQQNSNDIALALGQLRDMQDAALGGRTAGEYYTAIVVDLGIAISTAADAASVHQTLALNAETRRAAVSGVSTDEELVKLVQHQTAYSAAAKVVTTVDEMLQTLLTMV